MSISLIKFIIYTNFQVHVDSESSSDAQNIQIGPKCQNLLPGGAYHKVHLVDENGQPLHPANFKNIASSSHIPKTMMVIIIFWYINVIISMLNQLIMHCRCAYYLISLILY